MFSCLKKSWFWMLLNWSDYSTRAQSLDLLLSKIVLLFSILSEIFIWTEKETFTDVSLSKCCWVWTWNSLHCESHASSFKHVINIVTALIFQAFLFLLHKSIWEINVLNWWKTLLQIKQHSLIETLWLWSFSCLHESDSMLSTSFWRAYNIDFLNLSNIC